MKCCNCKNDFPETYFYRDKSKSTGHKPRCKKCELLYIDKSRRRKYEKEYWSDPARKEEKRKRIKSIREKNLDAFNRTQSQYRKTERYKILHRKDGSLRRARISFDHYIPIAKGGEHIKSNIRTSCMICNRIKAAKLPQVV